MAGKVLRWARVTRKMARNNPGHIFVFGDNMQGCGLGGQAKELRGEPNAIGVPTKWAPGRAARDYFTPDDWKHREVFKAVSDSFDEIERALAAGCDVVIPADGLGTGLSELPARCPKLFAYIEYRIAALTPNPDGGE